MENNKKNRLLILGWWADRHIGFFSDLYGRDDVIIHYVEPYPLCWPLKILRLFHLSGRLFRMGITLPYRYIWFDYGRHIDLSEVSKIICINGVLDKINYQFLQNCKDHGIEVNLFLLDSIGASSVIMQGNRKNIFRPIWNHVYSFEPCDVKEYGFEYLGFCYYSMDKTIQVPSHPKYDLYFSGNTKGGRYELIHKIYQFVADNRGKAKFEVQLQNKKEEKKEGVHYNYHWISYHEVLLGLAESRCILEIVQKNQTGPSLRYFEAVCYNKKLITNNPYIKDFPYYNPQWMKVICTANDIDMDWLVSDEEIDYHYNGDFSPTHLVDFFLGKNN